MQKGLPSSLFIFIVLAEETRMEIWPDWDGPGLKCPYGSSDRLWQVPAADANEEFCSQKCLDDAACVTYTALWGSWCIGCSVAPTGSTWGNIEWCI